MARRVPYAGDEPTSVAFQTETREFYTPGAWSDVPPKWARRAKLTLIGGGAGGCTAVGPSGGAGGSCGEIIEDVIEVDGPLSGTIGTGGASNQAGGNTTCGSLTARGGKAGSGYTPGGIWNQSGNRGGRGNPSSNSGSGGGGGAGGYRGDGGRAGDGGGGPGLPGEPSPETTSPAYIDPSWILYAGGVGTGSYQYNPATVPTAPAGTTAPGGLNALGGGYYVGRGGGGCPGGGPGAGGGGAGGGGDDGPGSGQGGRGASGGVIIEYFS